jgi:very-short-patch-repair endonuclease
VKSPIEIKLRDALRHVPPGINLCDYTKGPAPIGITDLRDPHWDARVASEACDAYEVIERPDEHGCWADVFLYADVPVLSYRADMYITSDGHALIIECDGHDYHSVTKQQAAYDRSRDRELLKLDISTIRFTGSEIHHSAERCSADVWAIVRMFSARASLNQQTFCRGRAAGLKAGLARIVGPGSLAGVL